MSDEQDKKTEAKTPAPEPSDEAADASAPDVDGGEQPADTVRADAGSEQAGSDVAESPAATPDADAAAPEPAPGVPEPAESAPESPGEAAPVAEPAEPVDDAAQEGEQTAAAEAEPDGDAAEPTADAPTTEAASESDVDEGPSVDGGEPTDAFDTAADLVAESGDDACAEAPEATSEPADTAEKWTDPLAEVEGPGPGAEADEPGAEGAAVPVADDDGGPDIAADAPAVAGGAPEVAGGAPEVAGDAPEVAGGAPDAGGTPIDVLPLEVVEAIAQTKQRRRRLSLYVAVPALAIGLLVLVTQLRFGRGGTDTPAEVRDWETGMALVQAGDIPKGIEMLESVVATLPQGADRALAHVRLADEYRTLGETESHYLNSAILHYTSALDWAESAAAQEGTVSVDELLLRTGQCFAALGSYEMALEFYEQIDTEFPTSVYRPQSRFEAGEALLAIGQYERGRQMLADVAAAYRGDPLGEEAFFRFADSFDEQARSLGAE